MRCSSTRPGRCRAATAPCSARSSKVTASSAPACRNKNSPSSARLSSRAIFKPGYTVDELRERRGPSGETGLVIAAQTGRFPDLLRAAKGGLLLPADLYHPDEGLDTVMGLLMRDKKLQQFFDPGLWVERTGPVLDAYDSLPAQAQKRVRLDSIRAQINQREIMKKAKGFNNGTKAPKLPKPPGSH
jgi:hypothetical protein